MSVAALFGLAGFVCAATTMALTRSVFAAMMALAGAGAFAALAALGLGAPLLALGLGVTLIVLTPVALFGAGLAMPATAPRGLGPAGIGAALSFGLLAALLAWAAWGRGGANVVVPLRPEAEALWVGVISTALGLGAFGLLAYGERGAFGGDDEEAP